MSQIRDTFADEAHFLNYVAKLEAAEQHLVDKEAQVAAGSFKEREPGHLRKMSWGNRINLLECRYSIGDPVLDLANEFSALITEVPEIPALNLKREGYLSVELCGWAVLLDDRTAGETLATILERDGALSGTQRFLLAAAFNIHSDTPDEFPVDDYWIGHAQRAISDDQTDAARQMLYDFVNHQWFQQLYNSGHRMITHTGDKIGHTGYWCYEGAAVAKALHIDDSRLETHKYYPWDLAHTT